MTTKFAHKFGVGSRLKTYFQNSPTKKFGGENKYIHLWTCEMEKSLTFCRWQNPRGS